MLVEQNTLDFTERLSAKKVVVNVTHDYSIIRAIYVTDVSRIFEENGLGFWKVVAMMRKM